MLNYFIIILPLIISLFDVISIYFPIVSKFGFIFWLSGVVSIICVAGCYLKQLISAKNNNITFLVFLAIIALVSLAIVSDKNISHESTQQISCALNRLKVDKDFGNLSSCFLGYPNRQYYLACVPTLLFGKGHIQLNTGYSIYLFIGLLIFIGGLKNYLPSNLKNDILCALSLSLFFQVNYFRYHLLNFEQSIFPFCFSLIICGLFLQLLHAKNKFYLSLFVLSIFQSIYSYTPSLSLLFPAVIGILAFYISNKSKADRIYSLLLLFGLLAELIVSYKIRTDVGRMLVPENGEDFNSKINQMLEFIVAPADGNYGIVSKILAAIIILSLILMFVTFFVKLFKNRQLKNVLHFPEFYFFITAIWSVAVLFISILVPGYANPPVHFAIHRTTLVFPFIFATIAVWFSEFCIYLLFQQLMLLSLLVIALYKGYICLDVDQKAKFIDDRLALIQILKPKIAEKNKNLIVIQKHLDKYFGNIGDYLLYFNQPEINFEFVEQEPMVNYVNQKCAEYQTCFALELKKRCEICKNTDYSPSPIKIGERTYILSSKYMSITP